MKLSELIEKYGDDKVIFQNLDNDMLSMDKKKTITKSNLVQKKFLIEILVGQTRWL